MIEIILELLSVEILHITATDVTEALCDDIIIEASIHNGLLDSIVNEELTYIAREAYAIEKSTLLKQE